MSWVLHLRARHRDRGTVVTYVVDSLPVVLGREQDTTQVPCGLVGDDRLSKVHASVDIRDGRVHVRDLWSTNGTSVSGRALERGGSVDAGSVEESIRVELAGCWEVELSPQRQEPAPPGQTVVDPLPFGATQSATVVGQAVVPGGFAGALDRVSEPAYAAGSAMATLRRAVAAELQGVHIAQRPELARALLAQFPDLASDAALSAELARATGGASPSELAPADAALAALQELSRWYVDAERPVRSASEVRAFAERLRSGVDELVLGVVRLVGGVDSYEDRMSVDVKKVPYPRDASGLGRAVFDWRKGSEDGRRVVRRVVLDLMVQQLGAFRATVRGVQALLAELAPEALRRAWEARVLKKGRLRRAVARLAQPWGLLAAYRSLHTDLASEQSAWFGLLFGPRFAEEYRALAAEAEAWELGPPQSTHSKALRIGLAST